MKLWIDDVREAPEGYVWLKSSNEALRFIMAHGSEIELIDLDHDAGDYATEGGDYIEILKELERLSHKRVYHNAICDITFRLHSMNPVGVENMRAIIQRNAWKEIK
jgi:hypothetical protein